MKTKKQNYIPLSLEIIIIQAENGYAASVTSNENFVTGAEGTWD